MLKNFIVVKIKARYGVIGFRLFGLLFNRDDVHILIEFDHTVALWISNLGPKIVAAINVGQFLDFIHLTAVENVITEYHGHFVTADEIGADDIGLGQAVR